MNRVKFMSRVTLAIMVLAGLLLTGCDSGALFAVPSAVFLKDPPLLVTAEQIFYEYSSDPVQADLQYLGKRVMFDEVTVDGLVTVFNYQDRQPGGSDYTMHFISGNIKYQLRDFSLMQSIKKDYILNIVGICQGIQGGYVVVDDCWVQSVYGELSQVAASGGY